ncbi:hypothetical protein GCM10023159_19620 [Brevibacterium yomogidense]
MNDEAPEEIWKLKEGWRLVGNDVLAILVARGWAVTDLDVADDDVWKWAGDLGPRKARSRRSRRTRDVGLAQIASHVAEPEVRGDVRHTAPGRRVLLDQAGCCTSQSSTCPACSFGGKIG